MTVSRRQSLSPKTVQKFVSVLDDEQTYLSSRKEDDNTLSFTKISLGLKEHTSINKPINGKAGDSKSFPNSVPLSVIKFKKPLCKCNISQATRTDSLNIPAIKLIPSTPVRHGAHHLHAEDHHDNLPEVDNDSQMSRKHDEDQNCGQKVKHKSKHHKSKS